MDESPDAYVADLQRLLELSGHQVDGDTDAVIVEQVIAGLPAEHARQLRMTLDRWKTADDQRMLGTDSGSPNDRC